jgi:CheY-like chemotaxis protein
MTNTDAGGIVIVDDNPNNLQVLSSILQQAGYKVRPALSGEIALRAIAASPPELILLDIRMPVMDGYVTCQRLKADPASRDIPVIFISALTETDDKLAAFRAGGVDYIS